MQTKVADIYASNPKVNSIIRTLLAQVGTKGLWTAVVKYIDTTEAKELDQRDIWQLYQTARWAKKWEEV